jgi:hypothetical protein
MAESSVAGIRPRFPFTNDQKSHMLGLIKDLITQIDQSKGPLRDYEYFAENLRALLEGRAQALPPVAPDSVPYVQEDWSDLKVVPIKALNLSKTVENLLRREGIYTVWELLITPEAEIFGVDRPRNLGTKSVAAIHAALDAQGLGMITDPDQIDLLDASNKTLSSNLFSLGVYSLKGPDFVRLFGNLGFATLGDLCRAKLTLADISAELLVGNYDFNEFIVEAKRRRNALGYGTEATEPTESTELSREDVERIARRVVNVFNDILTRFGQPHLMV